jgi:hypothetical protein
VAAAQEFFIADVQTRRGPRDKQEKGAHQNGPPPPFPASFSSSPCWPLALLGRAVVSSVPSKQKTLFTLSIRSVLAGRRRSLASSRLHSWARFATTLFSHQRPLHQRPVYEYMLLVHLFWGCVWGSRNNFASSGRYINIRKSDEKYSGRWWNMTTFLRSRSVSDQWAMQCQKLGVVIVSWMNPSFMIDVRFRCK